MMRADTWFALEVLWLFLPIAAANQMGHFPYWKEPVWVWGLGSNKTWGAYAGGPLFAVAVTALWWDIEPALSARFGVRTLGDALALGTLIGLGVVIGDQTNSFVKRRRDFKSGAPSITDRFDWALGGGLAALAFVPNVEPTHVGALVDMAIPLHVYFNRNSHRRGWRKTEH